MDKKILAAEADNVPSMFRITNFPSSNFRNHSCATTNPRWTPCNTWFPRRNSRSSRSDVTTTLSCVRSCEVRAKTPPDLFARCVSSAWSSSSISGRSQSSLCDVWHVNLCRLPKDEALPLMERTLERCSTGGSASGSSSLVTTPRDDVSTVAKTLNDPPPVETAQSFTIISATPPPCASPLPSRRRQGSPSRKSQPHKPVERSLSPFDKQWQHSVAAQNSPSKQRSKTSVSQQKAPNGRHFESVQTRDFNRAGSPSRRNYTDLDRDMMRSAPPDILSRRQRYLRPDCDIGRDDGRGDGGCHRNDHRRPVSKQGELSSDSDSVNGRKPVNYYYREKVPPLDLGFGDEGHDKKMLNDISGFQYTPLGVAPSLRKSRPVIPKERSLESIFRASLGEKFETDDLRTSAERDSSDGSTPRQQQEPAYVTERSRDHSRDFVAHVSKTTQIPTPGPKWIKRKATIFVPN